MKDLQKLYHECLDELSSIGIVCGNIKCVTVNTRAKKRWGLCKRVEAINYASPVPVYEYEISISYRLLEDSVRDEAAKNTIIHELLHTCEGGHGHRGNWQKLANRVNAVYGYNIQRTTSSEEKGIESVYEKPVLQYAVACTHCGHEYHRLKMTSVIKTPERYRCSHCGGNLKRVK